MRHNRRDPSCILAPHPRAGVVLGPVCRVCERRRPKEERPPVPADTAPSWRRALHLPRADQSVELTLRVMTGSYESRDGHVPSSPLTLTGTVLDAVLDSGGRPVALVLVTVGSPGRTVVPWDAIAYYAPESWNYVYDTDNFED